MNKKEVELTKYFDNMCIIFNTKRLCLVSGKSILKVKRNNN